MLKLVKKHFSGLTRAPKISINIDDKMAMILSGNNIALNENRYFSYQSGIKNPKLRIIFPTVPRYHKHEAALNIIADFLGKDDAFNV